MSPDRTPGDVPGPPRRILWLVMGLGPGGAEHLLLASARHRDVHRWDCRVGYVLDWKRALVERIEEAGVPTVSLGVSRVTDPRWLLRLRGLLAAEHPDLVHVHSPLVGVGTRLVVRTLPRRLRPRLVTTEHSVWSSHAGVTARLNALTAAGDDARFAVSERVRASMPARLGRDTEVVLHGVDVEHVVAARGARDRVRSELGIAPDEVVVGTVANLRAVKGYPELLDAAAAVTRAFDRVRFVAVGQGPLEAQVAARHRELGLGDRFLLLGHRPDAVEVMAGCDVFCLASHDEGLPVALMEALVLGLPVVSTRVGGIPEVVEDGREAVLVEPRDPGALATALGTVLDDDGLRSRMAALAAARGQSLDARSAIRYVERRYAEVLAG